MAGTVVDAMTDFGEYDGRKKVCKLRLTYERSIVETATIQLQSYICDVRDRLCSSTAEYTIDDQ